MTFNLSIDKIFNNLRKLTPVFLAVGIVTGSVLFLPYDILEKLHISNIPENRLALIGLIFLMSIFLMVIIVCQSIISWIGEKLKYTLMFRNLKRGFHSLSLTQKRIIQELLLNEEKYVILKTTDGNAVYLTEKGYIWRPQQAAMLVDHDRYSICCKYMAQPWLLSAYNKDPDFFFKNMDF